MQANSNTIAGLPNAVCILQCSDAMTMRSMVSTAIRHVSHRITALQSTNMADDTTCCYLLDWFDRTIHQSYHANLFLPTPATTLFWKISASTSVSTSASVSTKGIAEVRHQPSGNAPSSMCLWARLAHQKRREAFTGWIFVENEDPGHSPNALKASAQVASTGYLWWAQDKNAMMISLKCGVTTRAGEMIHQQNLVLSCCLLTYN
jgi:hypothetical protein